MDTPAPWSLSGRGFIMMYRFPAEFVSNSCFLPDEWKEMKWSGLGYVMLVDYQVSPVGPYKELLIIPGKSRFDGNRLATISKIYVDSIDSMMNGRDNWGIPKELSDFTWTTEDRSHIITVGGTDPWFEIVIETGSLPIPIDTRLIPIKLYQEYNNQTYRTLPTGKGTGHFSLIKEIRVNSSFFPDIDELEPLVSFYVDPFTMNFPAAKIEKINADY